MDLYRRIVAGIRWISPIVLIAAAPEGKGNGPIADWYRSLVSPVTHYFCCDVSDCRPVEYRIKGNHFEVYIDRKSFGSSAPNDWIPVPPEAVLHRENPVGEAVACYVTGEVRCFVEASGA